MTARIAALLALLALTWIAVALITIAALWSI